MLKTPFSFLYHKVKVKVKVSVFDRYIVVFHHVAGSLSLVTPIACRFVILDSNTSF